jgi:hypothetical protein
MYCVCLVVLTLSVYSVRLQFQITQKKRRNLEQLTQIMQYKMNQLGEK